MDKNKVEDQLLQDASTLLMFANVAAKQQQTSETESQPPVSNPTTTAPPHKRASPIDILINKSPAPEPVPVAPKQPVQIAPSPVVGGEPRRTAESAPPVKPPTSLSAPPPSLPPQGNFAQHKRTPSDQGPALYGQHRSPGPANVALARGGADGNNAMIAAAALAAAADIPLPLKKREEPKNTPENIKESLGEAIPVKTEPQVQVPPLEQYKVDPDSGLIGCICGLEDDDGFTIQCDVCFRWQHCVCMGYKTNEEVPEDEYKCYYCDVNKHGRFDAELCKKETLERLGEAAEVKLSPVKRKHLTSLEDSKRRKQAKPEIKREKSKDKVPPKEEEKAAPAPAPVEFVPNKQNEQLEEGVLAEFYQSVYYKLRNNDYKRPSVRQWLEQLGHQVQTQPSNVVKMSLVEFDAIKFSRVILPNHQKHIQERNELRRNKSFNTTAVQIKSYNDNPKQKFNGITRLGLFISGRLGETTIPANTPVMEYLGEVNTFANYKNDKLNQYGLWGTTKPQVVRANVTVDEKDELVVLDARFVGNEARFIRRACPDTVNCQITPVHVGDTNTFRFLVYTTKEIELSDEKPDEELRLPWDWDAHHPILKMYGADEGLKFDQFPDEEKSLLITGVDTVLHFAECGCTTSNRTQQCALHKVRKAMAYLQRLTRKVSGISNLNLSKSREELIKTKHAREFSSWTDRLLHRDNIIQMSLTGGAVGGVGDLPKDAKQQKVSVHVLIKQQLVAGGKALDYEVPPPSKVPAFPLQPEVMVQIKQALGHEETAKKNPQPVVEVPQAAPAAPDHPPAPVKKLSFADYKKKMK